LDHHRRNQDLSSQCHQQRDGNLQQSARNHAVDLDRRHLGRLEVAARYSDLDLNWHEGTIGQTAAQAPVGGVRGGEEQIVTLGLNLVFQQHVLMRLDYLIARSTSWDSSPPASHDASADWQNFNAFGLRLQYSN